MKKLEINLPIRIGLLGNALFLISRQLDFIPHYISFGLAVVGIAFCVFGCFSSEVFKARRKAKLNWIKRILHIKENSL